MENQEKCSKNRGEYIENVTFSDLHAYAYLENACAAKTVKGLYNKDWRKRK